MRLLCILLCSLAIVGAQSVGAASDGWNGIVPLSSTRAQVERALGPLDPDCECYRFGNETIRVVYSNGPDTVWGPGRWNVAEDVVLEVEVEYDDGPRFDDLGLDLDRFDEYHGGCVPGGVFVDEEEGVSYEVSDDEVLSVTYGPTDADRKQLCSDPGDFVPGRPKQVVVAGGPPMCASVTADRSVVSSGEQVTLTANCSDPNGNPLSYTWVATGGSVDGDGASVVWSSLDLVPGEYTIVVQANDEFGHAVEASITITLR